MSAQPEPTPIMTVAADRNAQNVPTGPPHGPDWNFKLFDCFSDIGTCCLSCWCPCVTYGRLKHRYDHLRSGGRGPAPGQGDWWNEDCALHGCLTILGASFAMQFPLRGNIRERYKIEGGVLNDCCAAFWCTPCELTQESRELEVEEGSHGKSAD